jgi:hypothetical protein
VRVYTGSGLCLHARLYRARQPEAAAAAVVCFESLQRPENVLSGHLRWSDCRSKDWPSAIKIEHHKTGAIVWHLLASGKCFG